MQTRIYIVETDGTKRLVEATSSAQAIRHCAKPLYASKVATTKDMAELMAQGKQVEKAIEQVIWNVSSPGQQGLLVHI